VSLKIAFIDADILLHRAVSFTEDEFEGQTVALPQQALWVFNDMLETWLKQVRETVDLEDYHLVITVGKNFRYGLYDEYKGNRKDIAPHPAMHGLKELVKEYQSTVWEEGIEADDYIGIKVTETPGAFAVSADKDFATVPCHLYVPASHGKPGSWHHFSEDEANLNWLRQTMTGDTIDNYKGIPRVGKVKAAGILPRPEPVDVMWPKVVAGFVKAGLTEDDALTMARLARILRAGEYDFKTKRVKLWEPSGKVIASAA